MKYTFYIPVLFVILTVFSCTKDTSSHTEELPIPILAIQLEDSIENISKYKYISGTCNINGMGEHDDLSATIEIRGRGNSTWSFPKKPFQLKFEESEEFLGMPEDKKWILLANYSDKSMLRTELAFEMGRISSLDWTPQSRFVELYVNDKYEGTYQVTQKVEQSESRVDIGKEGFLLEVDQLDRVNPNDIYFETSNHLFNIKEPVMNIRDERYRYIKSHITLVEETILGENCLDPINGYMKYLDLNALVDWYLINEITKNNDAIFYTSVYMNMVRNEKIKMGPIWDFDISLGNINYNDNEIPEEFWIKKASWIQPLFEDPLFIDKLKERFNYFYSKKDEISNKVTLKANVLNKSQNFQRWDILGKYVWPNHVYFSTYEEEVEYLLHWFDTRMEWLFVAINEL